MGEAAVKQRTRPDYRAMWENQHDNSIKREVEEELENWGRAYRDSGPYIGYPTRQPWYTPPRDQRDKRLPAEPAPKADEAQWTEDQFVMWRLIMKEAPPHIQEKLERLHTIAVRFFVHRAPMARIAKEIGVTRQYSYELKDELLFQYWVISQ